MLWEIEKLIGHLFETFQSDWVKVRWLGWKIKYKGNMKDNSATFTEYLMYSFIVL